MQKHEAPNSSKSLVQLTPAPWSLLFLWISHSNLLLREAVKINGSKAITWILLHFLAPGNLKTSICQTLMIPLAKTLVTMVVFLGMHWHHWIAFLSDKGPSSSHPLILRAHSLKAWKGHWRKNEYLDIREVKLSSVGYGNQWHAKHVIHNTSCYWNAEGIQGSSLWSQNPILPV